MIHIGNNDYGFPSIRVDAEAGGRVVIADYRKDGQDSDIGLKSTVNAHGLGGSEYIRNVNDVDKHISSIKRTVWLSDEEKKACIDFLKNMKG